MSPTRRRGLRQNFVSSILELLDTRPPHTESPISLPECRGNLRLHYFPPLSSQTSNQPQGLHLLPVPQSQLPQPPPPPPTTCLTDEPTPFLVYHAPQPPPQAALLPFLRLSGPDFVHCVSPPYPQPQSQTWPSRASFVPLSAPLPEAPRTTNPQNRCPEALALHPLSLAHHHHLMILSLPLHLAPTSSQSLPLFLRGPCPG